VVAVLAKATTAWVGARIDVLPRPKAIPDPLDSSVVVVYY